MNAVAPLNWRFPEKLEFLFKPARYKVAKGGRGGAKSWGFARALLTKGFMAKLRIGCFREVQNSIAESVHHLLEEQIELMGLSAFYTVTEKSIVGANGTEFIFKGLSNLTADAVKSMEGLDIAWIEEAHTVTRKSLDKLIPTVRKEGSEIWISFNPELDTDEVWTRFVESPSPDAVVVTINWNDNPFLPSTLDKERREFLRLVREGRRSQDDYDNIWDGKCRAAVEGAIYAQEVSAAKIAGRLTRVPYDPLLKVHAIWDLGWADYMSITCVQRQASEVRIINYVEGSHRRYDEYVNGWDDGPADKFVGLANLRYNWGADWLPHDGRAKNPQTGKSPQQVLKALGRNCEETNIIDEIGLENGIKAARQMFPRCYFDKEQAGLLFNHLGRYRRRINATTGLATVPLHDEHSHGADGFRGIAVVEERLTNDTVDLGDYYAAFRRRA